jgi:hypothetical protein
MRTTDDTFSIETFSSTISNTRGDQNKRNSNSYSPAFASVNSINMKNYHRHQQIQQQAQQQSNYQEPEMMMTMMQSTSAVSSSMPMYYTSNIPMRSVNTSAAATTATTTTRRMGMYSSTMDPTATVISIPNTQAQVVLPVVTAATATAPPLSSLAALDSFMPQGQPRRLRQLQPQGSPQMGKVNEEAQAKKKKEDLAEMRRLRHLEIVRRGRMKKKVRKI